MADNLGKPMVFVRVDADYKQEGWLGLVMGKTLWIDANDRDVLPKISKRFTQIASVTPKQVTASPLPLTIATNNNVAPQLLKLDEVHTMVSSLVQQMNNLQDITKDMQKEIADIKQMQVTMNHSFLNKQ